MKKNNLLIKLLTLLIIIAGTEPGCPDPSAGSAGRRWHICLLEAR